MMVVVCPKCHETLLVVHKVVREPEIFCDDGEHIIKDGHFITNVFALNEIILEIT